MTLSLESVLGDFTDETVQRALDVIAEQFPVSVANSSQVPQARVYNSANISIANATLTPLAFNSERFDTNNTHDTAVNSSRLTCVTPGLYVITANVAWAVSAAGAVRYAAIRLNATTSIADDVKQPSATHNSNTSLTTMYRLVAGDYVEVAVQQDSGGALNVVAASNTSPEFAMHWVSP